MIVALHIPLEIRAGQPASLTMTEEEQKALDSLLHILNIEQRDENHFHADTDQQEGRLFGGLILAQSVMAAGRTVKEGDIHSLHAYFLRAGKPVEPVDYMVERVRDGRTFTTRRVSAIQAGNMIFEASISFTLGEEGIEHQTPMPQAPEPADLPTWWESMRASMPPEMQAEMEKRGGRGRRGWNNPIDLRSVAGGRSAVDENGLPHRVVWGRMPAALPEDPLIHAAAMAYFSDSGLIATVDGGRNMWRPGGSAASLDHAIWWHYPPRFDDWLLYSSYSPVAHAARALVLGSMYTRGGVLVASVAQEGLYRASK